MVKVGFSKVLDEKYKTISTEQTDLLFSIQQAQGSISVSSSPEDGMLIYINNRNTGLSTPATVNNILVGENKVKLVHPLYREQEKTVTVIEGETIFVDFEMVAAYAELTVNTSQDGIIYLNGTIKGTTSWKGKVGEGSHTVKVIKDGFFSREHQVTIIRGRDINIDLMMRPKTGSLEVITDPPQAMITLDGRMHGLTPRVIENLPIGSYMLTLEKPEYTSVSMRVTIDDIKTKTIEVSMVSGKDVTINSSPSGAKVFINQEEKGVTPLKLWLKFDSHLVRIEKEDKVLVENITVTHSGKNEFDFSLRDSNDPFDGQMVFVKGGSFRMGDTFGDGNREEKPVHPVTVDDFYIGKFEVTQAQWKAIMGSNPSHFNGCDECPVERVSWEDVHEFLARLNELTGENYRLPTEAEWEYAAKGGEKSQGFRYAGKNNINFVSWYAGNSESKTNPVGQMEPNELGLYDMSGNVWEWVHDWFGYYTDTPKTNPKGPEKGDFKIVKGGSWYGYIGGSRVSCRGSDDPGNQRSYIGFRVAKSAE